MLPESPLLACQHPLRSLLAGEVHARPSEAIATPSRASFLAVLIAPDDRARELEHLAALCAGFGVEPPDASSNHFSVRLGELHVRWERHSEFSGYTFRLAGLSPAPFSEPPVMRLPPGWLAAIPGRTLVATHCKVIAAPATCDADFIAAHFDGNVVAGGEVGDGAGAAYTDFRIHADGYSRFLLVDAGFTVRQTGRMMQRLLEIETYRMMALLALPIAHQQSARLATLEAALASITAAIAEDSRDDEALLHRLTDLAAQVESGLAGSQFRFSACRAYGDLVRARIDELRERRLPGVQPIEEFMARRFTPAIATCAAVAERLHALSERVARASGLLLTRVDIARERQNQALLASMDRRAKLQLRLQQTVEGLSVAAIVYYAAGLVGYAAKGLKSIGIGLNPDLVVGASVPVLVVLVTIATRRASRHIHAGGGEPEPGDLH